MAGRFPARTLARSWGSGITVELGRLDSVQANRIENVAELVDAKVDPAAGRRLIGPEHLSSGCTHQDLGAVGRVHHPSGSVHCGTEVILVTLLRLAAVEAHADRESKVLGPGHLRQCALPFDRGLERGLRAIEGDGEPVSTGREHVTPMGSDHRAQDTVMKGQRDPHVVGTLLPGRGRPFDVGEEERHRA